LICDEQAGDGDEIPLASREARFVFLCGWQTAYYAAREVQAAEAGNSLAPLS
jgi:hypothetical protein